MSQEVARLEELLARVQRNAALPRSTPVAFAVALPAPASVVSALPSPAPVFAASQVAFDPAPLQPVFEAPLPYPPAGDHEARQVQPAALDQSVDDMLLADPFPSVAPAPPPQQSLTDMLDEDASPHVSVTGHQPAPGEDISGVMNRSDLADEPPEELLEDDIVEMSPSEAEGIVAAGNNLDDLNFDDEDMSADRDRDRQRDEPPASSSRHKVAGTMDEALARAAEQIEHDDGREVPLKTPPPESGPQAAMALPVGIHAPLAPDIEELLEADILPVGGVNAAVPTTEQLGQTIELEEARGPHLELDSALAAAPTQHEQPHEELEVTLPRREFGGGYQDDLMPPPEARQDLDAHRQRFGDDSVPPPPESLGQYPSQRPAPHTDGFAPQIVPASVSTDSYSEHVSTVTVDAPARAEFAPELLVRPEIAAAPVAKFIRVEPARPNTFLELLDASLALGSN
ncbi:MAG TPA: hypothetical protein VHW01_19785 [Polyangiaceae bacterium]|nr:hypothetical protein [Polyangiaceae bacterium]